MSPSIQIRDVGEVYSLALFSDSLEVSPRVLFVGVVQERPPGPGFGSTGSYLKASFCVVSFTSGRVEDGRVATP